MVKVMERESLVGLRRAPHRSMVSRVLHSRAFHIFGFSGLAGTLIDADHIPTLLKISGIRPWHLEYGVYAGVVFCCALACLGGLLREEVLRK